MIMELSGVEKEKRSQETRLNDYIVTFQLQKIIHNGVEGFFIPFAGYKRMLGYLNDYIYLQDLILIKDDRIKQLEHLEIINFRLKTGLGIAISFDVGSILLCAGLGILCYNLAIYDRKY